MFGSTGVSFGISSSEHDAAKLDKLKQLNNILVKEWTETMEKKNTIRFQMLELCGDLDDSLLAGLDLSVSLVYLKKCFDKLVKENQELHDRIYVMQRKDEMQSEEIKNMKKKMKEAGIILKTTAKPYIH